MRIEYFQLIDRIVELDLEARTIRAEANVPILAVPVRDTMKRGDGSGRIARTEDRNDLWHALTPQMFRFGLLSDALQRALADGFVVTDEASAIEHIGLKPRLVEGRADNIKVTRPEDLALAGYFLERNKGL